MLVNKLHKAIEAVCPIEGVSLGANNSIRIDFKSEASDTQKSAAQAVANSWDFAASAAEENIYNQIAALEVLQTPRRIRESSLGIDNGWLANLETQINALRAQI